MGHFLMLAQVSTHEVLVDSWPCSEHGLRLDKYVYDIHRHKIIVALRQCFQNCVPYQAQPIIQPFLAAVPETKRAKQPDEVPRARILAQEGPMHIMRVGKHQYIFASLKLDIILRIMTIMNPN